MTINPYSSDHSHSISYSHNSDRLTLNMINEIARTLYNDPIKQEADHMTTLDKVRNERREARERRRIEAMYADYDAVGLDQMEDGRVITFTWSPEHRDHPYTYAALYVARKWYVTGGQAPNGLATEDFVAWLIGKEITSNDLTFLEPLS